MIRKWADKLDKLVKPLSTGFAFIGASTLLLIMFLTFFDVTGRYCFSKPVIGSYELVEYGLVITVFGGMAITQIRKQHVNVNLITEKLHGRSLYFVESLGYLVSFVIIVLFLWGGIKQLEKVYLAQQVSSILTIPHWPFQMVLVLGVFLFCLTLIVDFLKSMANLIDVKPEVTSDDKSINPPTSL